MKVQKNGWAFALQPLTVPTTVDFAISILNDWAIVTLVLGLLLAMAMIGASYLVRDERLVNLLYDMGGDE